MIPFKRILMPLALMAGCLIPSARADVTMTEQNIGTEETPVMAWIIENQYLQAAVQISNGRLVGLVKKTEPGADGNQAVPTFASYLDRIAGAGVTNISVTPGGDATRRTLTVTGVINANAAGIGTVVFNFSKVYFLEDGSRVFGADLTFENTDEFTDWLRADPQQGAESIMYVAPGGSVAAAQTDEIQVKTTEGIDIGTTGTVYWGTSNTGELGRPELTEGWFAGVDFGDSDDTSVVNAVTWPFDVQKQHMTNGRTTLRFFRGGNRFQMHPIFNDIKAGQTLSYRQTFIVVDGVPSVSYASPDSFVGGISLSSNLSQGDTVTATFRLTSTLPDGSAAASYDIRNIVVKNADGAVVATMTDNAGFSLPANQLATFARQFTLNASSFPGGDYSVQAEVYPAGGQTPITTLMSKTFRVVAAEVKVALYLDPASQKYILENEVLRLQLEPANGRVLQFIVKDAENRDWVHPSYPMFRDWVRETGSLTGFTGYSVTLDPSGTDSPTKKSISFSGYNGYGDVTRVMALESMSRSVEADISFVNLTESIVGEGFFSDVAVRPGGTGGVEDQFTARTVAGLNAVHEESNDPATPENENRWWFGLRPQEPGQNVLVEGHLPELAEPWMAVTDTNLGDAFALSWNRTVQEQYSVTPSGATGPVTMNRSFLAGSLNRHVLEPHFTNIPLDATVRYKQYVMADTGYGLVGYAEGQRVMAGIWTGSEAGGSVDVQAAITNTGTTARTFELRNIRLQKVGTTDTIAGPADVTGIALDPAARDARTLSVSLAGAAIGDRYVALADLYEGGALVATLETLPFDITEAALAGDVNNDGSVDLADALQALRIYGGLESSDPGQVLRGNLAPDTGGLTLEDVIAIILAANAPDMT